MDSIIYFTERIVCDARLPKKDRKGVYACCDFYKRSCDRQEGLPVKDLTSLCLRKGVTPEDAYERAIKLCKILRSSVMAVEVSKVNFPKAKS